uniref:Addiction module component n=1 Tax=Candidatus Kentrum sp. LPFa TaxID=2126335 RepID=A0A450WQY5_9GAMM|nr:MAG: Putative addiction module component [Candidatus Kentron sp. LPFa]
MNFQEIENEALHLPERDRAELTQRLLTSLDSHAEDRISVDWLLKAQRRAGKPDRGIVRPVPSESVARKAQPVDIAFLQSLEGTLNEWASEADEEAWREL